MQDARMRVPGSVVYVRPRYLQISLYMAEMYGPCCSDVGQCVDLIDLIAKGVNT
jgi:hypothetical protein